MSRPRNEDARDTRRDLLRAALDLFSELGFHATSMRALAAAVGIRESAIYHHFRSKDAVLSELFADYIVERTGAFENDMSAFLEMPFAKMLAKVAQDSFADMRTPKGKKLLRLMLVEGRQLGEEALPLRRLSEQPTRLMTKMLDHFKQKGEVRADLDAEVLRLHFAAPLLVASNALGASHPLGMSMDKFLEQHIEFIVRAVAPSVPARAKASPPARPLRPQKRATSRRKNG